MRCWWVTSKTPPVSLVNVAGESGAVYERGVMEKVAPERDWVVLTIEQKRKHAKKFPLSGIISCLRECLFYTEKEAISITAPFVADAVRAQLEE